MRVEGVRVARQERNDNTSSPILTFFMCVDDTVDEGITDTILYIDTINNG